MACSAFAVTVPRPAGDIPFTIPGKGADNVSKYRGKVVLLMAFLTTCEHCQATTKVLTGIQNDYRKMGLQVIGLAFREDDDTAAVQKFITKFKPGFPVGIVDANILAQFSQITAEMRPTAPMLFFIDRQGLVQSQYLGRDALLEEKFQDENIRAKLLQYLVKRPPKK